MTIHHPSKSIATAKQKVFSNINAVPDGGNVPAIAMEDEGKMDEGKMDEGGTINGGMGNNGYLLLSVHFAPSKYVKCNYVFVLEEKPFSDTERFIIKLDGLKEENVKLRSDMKRIAESQIAELKTENEDLIQKNGQLRTELDAAKITIDTLVQNQQQSNEETATLRTAMNTTNDTINTLTQSVQDTTESVDNLNQRMDASREEMKQNIDAQFTELKEETEALSQSNEQSNQSIQDLIQRVQQSDETITGLRTDRDQ